MAPIRRSVYALHVGTSVYLKLKDGSSVRIAKARDAAMADKIRLQVAQWLKAGTTISATNAHGGSVEITPTRVIAIDVTVEQ
jgi:hypothetical protein